MDDDDDDNIGIYSVPFLNSSIGALEEIYENKLSTMKN